ncbi:PTS glucitol/sorbitol transporter subunit IIA [Rodentibacter haemolyticus]|uniref:PTS glucitol/sorbitol transporter subunit IIA n=1 Tax=Rodentibacter haemolyticus TaxID=2778911 RepID=A0ABX6UYU8_9PAST|nr:PTS glucitol/sorbitol transporter subunit IIA [Rodentibacter haemolyticus]QPB42271.1 PTS glucitol/sorbitol transporter subunit IIA [Rodentibacter haemolyticus]
MTVIYQTKFTKIGKFARESLAENMLITFKQGAPADLEDYCFIHSHGELQTDIQVGYMLQIDNKNFQITAIGQVASINLKELGHVTWRFDGANIAEYPGTIHVKGNIPTNITENTILSIIKN